MQYIKLAFGFPLQVLVNDAVLCNFTLQSNLRDVKGILVQGEDFIYNVSLIRKMVNEPCREGFLTWSNTNRDVQP